MSSKYYFYVFLCYIFIYYITMINGAFVLVMRMLITMSLGFYATRELIKALGVSDFGLISLIISIATAITFVSTVLQASATKYFSSKIADKNKDVINDIFSLFLIIFFATGCLFLLFSELIGLYVIENHINIDESRLSVMLKFFHLYLISYLITFLTVPYWTFLISNEQINFYSLATIIEAVVRLILIMNIELIKLDAVVSYGYLLIFSSIFMLAMYLLYFHFSFPYLRFKPYWNTNLFKQIIVFSGWNVWGGLSGLFTNTLIGSLINNNFGSIQNASRAIGSQISIGIAAVVNNVLMVVRPKIIKKYAIGDESEALDLTINASKGCCYFMLLIGFPFVYEMDYILNIWLHAVPEYAVIFSKLMLIQKIIEVIAYPFVTLSHATGKIGYYQSFVAIIQWLIFPVALILIKYEFDSVYIFYASIFLAMLCFFAQLIMINNQFSNAVSKYWRALFNFFILISLLILYNWILSACIDMGFFRLLLNFSFTAFIVVAFLIKIEIEDFNFKKFKSYFNK